MRIRTFRSEDELTTALCSDVERAILTHLKSNSRAGLVVSGGHSVRPFLKKFSTMLLPWNQIHITLSDERWVKLYSKDSNEHQLRSLYCCSQTAEASIIGLRTHGERPNEGLEEAVSRLDSFPFPAAATVLGFGQDGHVASLFEGDKKRNGFLIETVSPTAPIHRISMTMSTLLKSDNTFIVAPTVSKSHYLKNAIAKRLDCPITRLARRAENATAYMLEKCRA